MNKNKTILVFDSGVGGLSVYHELNALMPHHHYIYVFDNQGYPYGELGTEELIQRVNHYIKQFTVEYTIDLVVIACNTASTIVLPSLRTRLALPVVGVVPAIKPAASISQQGIGLIATPATVKRQYTHDLIDTFCTSAPVHLLGSTELVDMAELKLRGEAVDLDKLSLLLSHLKPHIDVAVLGCTHFPLLKAEIQSVLGSKITLVDSGAAIAKRVQQLLGDGVEQEERQQKAKRLVFCSAPPFKVDALNKMLQQLGFNLVQVRQFQDVLDH